MSNAEKALVRNAKEKVLRRLANRLKTGGFVRSRPTFYVRPCELVVEFLHLHKYTFAQAFRPHLGIRVLNDPHRSVNLNGPTSDAYGSPGSPTGRAHDFTFDLSEESIDRCAENLAVFVEFFAEPWFAEWRDPSRLVESESSPLHVASRSALAHALAGNADSAFVAHTRELLNVT